MKKRIVCLILTIIIATTFSVSALAATGSTENFKKVNTYTEGQFSDVKAKDWFASSVQNAYELNLIKGKSGSSFDPSGNITIAETLTLACRLNDIYYGGTGEFNQSTPWYQVYIDYAISNGIIKNGQFSNYTANATRAQFATIMAATLPSEALRAINSITSLPDVPTNASYAPSVYTLYNAGILTGNDSKGTFNPSSNIMRSEVATIVTRMADSAKRQSLTLPIAYFGDIVVNNIYTYDSPYSYKYLYFEITNTSSSTKEVSIQTVYKDASGKNVDTDTDSVNCLEAGKTCVIYTTTSSTYSTYTYNISSSKASSSIVPQVNSIKATCSESASGSSEKYYNFIQEIKNNSNESIEYVEYTILFFDNQGKVVDTEWGYAYSISGSSGIGAGETVYVSDSYIRAHASYKIYYTAYTYDWSR